MSQPAALAVGDVLEIRGADGVTRRLQLPLDPQALLIGRAADAQILLESTAVSRQHANLIRDEQSRWQIRDLGSRNGTLVNGQVIKEQVLRSGDQVQVGGFVLTLISALDDGDTPQPPALTGTGLLLSDEAGRLSTLNDLEAPRVAAGHLTTLSDLSQRLLQTDAPLARSLELCRLMVSPQFHGEWAVILRVPRGQQDGPPDMLCEPQRSPMARGASGHAPHVSRTLLRAVARQGEAVLASNVGASAAGAPADVEMSIAPGVMALAAVACPVRQDEQAVDVLYVTLPPQYGTSEWLALASLAGKQYQQAEQAWAARTRAADHAALERELEGARQIQMRLVPKRGALAGLMERGVDVAVGFAPSRWVGGDYVDALTMRDGRVLLAVGDVCGHGLAAALVTSAVHTLVHAAVRAGSDLRSLMDGLNQHLCETLPGEAFVTFAAIALDPASGAMEIVNAGHPPAVVVDGGGGAVRTLRAGANLPLGLDEAPLEGEAGQLEPGEVLVIYSDGLSEQPDATGSMLGMRGLREQVQAICADGEAGAEGLASQLSAFLAERQGGRLPEDDQSFLFARRV